MYLLVQSTCDYALRMTGQCAQWIRGSVILQLTRYTDYGLRVLIYLALLPHDRRASIDEVSDMYGLSRNNVNKLVHHLGKAGIIETVRGKNGGIRLSRKPDELNLGDLVKLLEKNLNIIDCQSPACVILPACRLKGIFVQATEAFLNELSKFTLNDLLDEKAAPLRQILDIS